MTVQVVLLSDFDVEERGDDDTLDVV